MNAPQSLGLPHDKGLDAAVLQREIDAAWGTQIVPELIAAISAARAEAPA